MTRTDNKPLFRNRSSRRAALLEARASVMRGSLTPTEQLLWSRICAWQLGVVFRRQVPLLGRFIADFLALAVRLLVEVDGSYHADRALAEAPRGAALGRAGYRVLRLKAELVVREIETVLARIRAAL
jgi:very-short-patch-repair endonuclease